MSNFIFSNEQKRIVEYDKNAVIQVNGCPGSGKTLVAIKKSAGLAKILKQNTKNKVKIKKIFFISSPPFTITIYYKIICSIIVVFFFFSSTF